jgi:hypothetical protein
MLSAETVSVVVLGVLLGVSEWRRRRREGKVAVKVVEAAASVEVKTDAQTTILTEMAHDIRNVRQQQLVHGETVGRIDRRLMDVTDDVGRSHKETLERFKTIDARQIKADERHVELAERVGTIASEVALLKQAGGMRKLDAPAYSVPPPPRRGDAT